MTCFTLPLLIALAFGPAALAEVSPAAKHGETIVLTRAVGEVGEHVVTSREVLLEEGIQQALDGKSTIANADLHELEKSDKGLPSAVSRVLDEWSIFLEARALSSKPVSHSEVGLAVKKVQDKWSGEAAWRDLEPAPDELRDMVERHLIAKEFERLKGDPQLVPVNDDDVLAYYRKNRERFGTLPFADIKDNIRTFLVKQQSEHRLAEWREVLRRKYKVRNFIAG